MLEKLIKIVKNELNVGDIEITPETRLVEDLGADSIDSVTLIMTVEDEFNVKVDDEAAQKIHTIGDIMAYIENYKE